MSQARSIGNAGECAAANLLQKEGYSILERNFHSRYGEIDIIAANCQYILFVEVKTRKQRSIVSGTAAVDIKKQRKLVKTAMMYLAAQKTDLQPRFDVISVATNENEGTIVSIEHLENAFLQEAFDEVF